jgi:hypothetical protein
VKLIVLFLTAFAAAGAQAQTQPPAATAPAAEAPAAEAPQSAHPPLKLRLNDADLRSLTPPSDSEKKTDDGLPTLGGKPSSALERKPSDVVPKDQSLGL